MDRATKREFNRKAKEMVQKHASLSVKETWNPDGSVSRNVTIDESNPADGELLLKMLDLSPAETEELMDKAQGQGQGVEQAPPSPEAEEMAKEPVVEGEQAPATQVDDQSTIRDRVQTGKKKVTTADADKDWIALARGMFVAGASKEAVEAELRSHYVAGDQLSTVISQAMNLVQKTARMADDPDTVQRKPGQTVEDYVAYGFPAGLPDDDYLQDCLTDAGFQDDEIGAYFAMRAEHGMTANLQKKSQMDDMTANNMFKSAIQYLTNGMEPEQVYGKLYDEYFPKGASSEKVNEYIELAQIEIGNQGPTYQSLKAMKKKAIKDMKGNDLLVGDTVKMMEGSAPGVSQAQITDFEGGNVVVNIEGDIETWNPMVIEKVAMKRKADSILDVGENAREWVRNQVIDNNLHRDVMFELEREVASRFNLGPQDAHDVVYQGWPESQVGMKKKADLQVGDEVEITYEPEKGQTGTISRIEGDKYFLEENPGVDVSGGAWYYAGDLEKIGMKKKAEQFKPGDLVEVNGLLIGTVVECRPAGVGQTECDVKFENPDDAGSFMSDQLKKIGMKKKADSPAQYLQTFFEEKQLTPQSWEIEGNDGYTHFIDSDVVIEAIMGAPENEQEGIANMIRKIDFANGDVNKYLEHLAKGLVNMGQPQEASLKRRGPVPEIELGTLFG